MKNNETEEKKNSHEQKKKEEEKKKNYPQTNQSSSLLLLRYFFLTLVRTMRLYSLISVTREGEKNPNKKKEFQRFENLGTKNRRNLRRALIN